MLIQLPLEGWTAVRRQDCRELLAQLDQRIARLDKAAEQAADAHPPSQLAVAAEESRTHHRPGLCPDHRRCQPFRALQSGSQLSLGLIPSEHTSSNKRRLGSITKQGNSFLRMLLVEAAQSVTGLDPQFHKHYVHLCTNKPKAVAKVAAAHLVGRTATGCYAPIRTPRKPCISRAARGCPWSACKLDRYIDWALSHPTVRRKRGNDGNRYCRFPHSPSSTTAGYFATYES